jgi:hypothetical protein
MADSPDHHPRDADRLIYAGLLGLTAAAVIQLSDKGDLNTPQLVGVYSFAVAAPLLAVGLVTDYARRAGAPISGWRDLIGVGGALAAVVGFGALYFHFGVGVGAVYSAGCILGLILVRQL